jgi:signal transduction histidine kinase
VAVLLTAALTAAGRPDPSALIAGHELVGAVVAVSFSAAGTVVLRHRPAHALGWVFLAIGWLEAVAGLGAAYAARRPSPPLAGLTGMIGDRLWLPGIVLALALITPLFPDGRPASPRWRPLVWAGAIVTALTFAGVWLVELSGDGHPEWTSPVQLPSAAQPALDTVAGVILTAAVLCGLLGIAGIGLRMRRATAGERRRLGWFVVAFTVAAGSQFLDSISPVFPLIGWALFPAGLCVAVLRHGLFDGDRLLSRTLVSIVLTILVAVIVGSAVGLGTRLLGGDGAGAIAAAVVIALGFEPALGAVRRGVDRVLYGRPRDPYAVLAELGRQLSAAIAPDEVLAVVVHAVVETLRLPYAAITLDDRTQPIIEQGVRPATTVDVPLSHAGRVVGRLTVGAPGGRAGIDPEDLRLLHDFARHVGAAAYGVLLTDDLRRSRDSLAGARDLERHRIHRDLHDGLGPALAGVALGLGAARRAAARDATSGHLVGGAGGDPMGGAGGDLVGGAGGDLVGGAGGDLVGGAGGDLVGGAGGDLLGDLLGSLEAEVRQSLDDVKRLVAELRPTALDQVGLLPALRDYAEAVTARSERHLRVAVIADGIPALPPPVEVAAYRIALEGVTNVARHAEATRCDVTLRVDCDVLTVTIGDDGRGIPAGQAPGLGLRSIAERAAELGGRAGAAAGPDGGTTVRAELPLWSRS